MQTRSGHWLAPSLQRERFLIDHYKLMNFLQTLVHPPPPSCHLQSILSILLEECIAFIGDQRRLTAAESAQMGPRPDSEGCWVAEGTITELTLEVGFSKLLIHLLGLEREL